MHTLSLLIAFLSTIVALAFLLGSDIGKRIQDVPNARSLHVTPTPRIGGICLMSGVALSWSMQWGGVEWWLVLPLLLLFVVSLLDDVSGLTVRVRLSAQLIAAAIFIAGAGFLQQYGALAAALLLIVIVLVTNFYNFMDGSDGLAGGMAVFGFIGYGVAGLLSGNDSIPAMSFAVSAAAAGFLLFNFPPAKVFMGDAGSIPLGFLVGAVGVMGWLQGCWEVWFPILLFSPFVADAGVTLVKRSMRGARITEAHREHYYQRAVQMGYGHKQVAIAEYILMAAIGTSAIVAMKIGAAMWLLLFWAAIFIAIMHKIDNEWQYFLESKK